MHVGGILVHLFLVVAATIGFLYDLGRPYHLEQWEYPNHPTATALYPCRFRTAVESQGYSLAFDRAARAGLIKISLCLVCLFHRLPFLPATGVASSFGQTY